ncbi:unnamed protein product, partial [Phaeothamnion confervicola]
GADPPPAGAREARGALRQCGPRLRARHGNRRAEQAGGGAGTQTEGGDGPGHRRRIVGRVREVRPDSADTERTTVSGGGPGPRVGGERAALHRAATRARRHGPCR